MLLYGAIFDVTLIDKKYSSRPITFELTFGNSSKYINDEAEGDGLPKNRTREIMPECRNKYFCNLDYKDQKPCFLVRSLMPDFRRRMYNANIVNKMAKELVLFLFLLILRLTPRKCMPKCKLYLVAERENKRCTKIV